MNANLLVNLDSLVNQLDFAFQPLVNIHTGACYGYEALLRQVENAGFPNIGVFFDHLYDLGLLNVVEKRLREKAIARFVELQVDGRYKLFYNLDNRLFENATMSKVSMIGKPSNGVISKAKTETATIAVFRCSPSVPPC